MNDAKVDEGNELSAAILDALERFAGGDTQRRTEFLEAEVGAEAATAIGSILDGIWKAEAEVAAARERGQTRVGWLAEKLGPEGVRALLPGDTDAAEDPVSVAKAALALAGNAWSLTDMERSVPALDQALHHANVSAPVSQLVDDFFQSDLDSDVERRVTSVLAAAAVKASGAKVGEAGFAASVSGVDFAARVAKVGYQYANGTIDSLDDAMDLISDRIAGQVAHFAGNAVETGLQWGATALGGFLDTKLGAGGVITTTLRTLATAASKAVRPMVERGVKTVVKTGLKYAAKAMKHVGKKIQSGFKWLVGG